MVVFSRFGRTKYGKSRLFLYGMARTFDMFGVLGDPKVEQIRKRSDADALYSDWEAIGNDLWRAMNIEHPENSSLHKRSIHDLADIERRTDHPGMLSR